MSDRFSVIWPRNREQTIHFLYSTVLTWDHSGVCRHIGLNSSAIIAFHFCVHQCRSTKFHSLPSLLRRPFKTSARTGNSQRSFHLNQRSFATFAVPHRIHTQKPFDYNRLVSPQITKWNRLARMKKELNQTETDRKGLNYRHISDTFSRRIVMAIYWATMLHACWPFTGTLQ